MRLYPQQIEGVKYLKTRPGGGFLFMGMRTGKTLTAIRSVTKFPVLVVCPNTVKPAWKSALISDGVSEDSIYIPEGKKWYEIAYTAISEEWIIINFEKLRRHDIISKIAEMGLFIDDWGTIICDESYRIANYDSKISFALLSTRPHEGQDRYCLSGSPASEESWNLASQFLFVDNEYFGCTSPSEYMALYYTWSNDTYKWYVRDSQHIEDVKQYVKDNAYCIDLEMLGLSSDKHHYIKKVQPNKKQLKLLHWIRNAGTYRYVDDPEETLRPMEPVVRVNFEQQIALGWNPLNKRQISGSKIDYIVQYIQDNPDKKCLIFTNSLLPIYPLMGCLPFPYTACIFGKTSKKDREHIRQKFQEGEFKYIVAQVSTVKMGLDFSSLDTIIYISNSYSQDDRTQSEFRGEHTERKTPYDIIDICTEGFICEYIVKTLKNKQLKAASYIKDLDERIRLQTWGETNNI